MEQKRSPPRRHVSRMGPGAGKSLQLMCSLVARVVSLLVPDRGVKSSRAAAHVSRSSGKVETPFSWVSPSSPAKESLAWQGSSRKVSAPDHTSGGIREKGGKRVPVL